MIRVNLWNTWSVVNWIEHVRRYPNATVILGRLDNIDSVSTDLLLLDSASSVFHTRHVSSRSSPTPQQRPPSNQSQPSSKRMRYVQLFWRNYQCQLDLLRRTSPHDDSPASANESRQSSQDSSNNVRDPFALQSHSKNSHSQLPLPSSAATTTTTTNMDRNWQSYVQQQYQHLSSSFGSRPPRSNNPPSGSITQGSPISPSTTRAIADSQQYQSASNNQLVNPRYSYYMNKSTDRVSPRRTPLDFACSSL